MRRIQEPEAWEPQINGAAFEALDMAIEALGQKQAAVQPDLPADQRHRGRVQGEPGEAPEGML